MKKPTKCPRCGSENIWRTFRKPDGDDGEVYSVLCKNCAYHWLETYRTRLEKIEYDERIQSLSPDASLKERLKPFLKAICDLQPPEILED